MKLISIAISVLSLIVASLLLADAAPYNLAEITSKQIHLLLVVLLALATLIRAIDKPFTERELQDALAGVLPVRGCRTSLRGIVVVASLSILVALGVSVVLLDLVGSIRGGLSAPDAMPAKLALMLVASNLVFQEWERHLSTNRVAKSLQAVAQARANAPSLPIAEHLSREGFHKFLYEDLDQYEATDHVYVSALEEYASGFRGYYVEKNFMDKWFRQARRVGFHVDQIVLVRTRKDLDDLNARLDTIKDIPNYYLTCLVAPPLSVFVDFYICSRGYAIVGFSTDSATPNQESDSVVIRDPGIIAMLSKSFEATFKAKAVPVKGREGVLVDGMRRVVELVEAIEASKVPFLKEMVNHGMLK